MKHNPVIGEHLYIYTPCNMYYVQAVRDPFTVESVSANGNTITIRAARSALSALNNNIMLGGFLQ